MERVESATAQTVDSDLMGQMWVGGVDDVLLRTKINLFISYMSRDSPNLDIQPSEFLVGTAYLEVSVKGEATGRCSPLPLLDILTSVTEEVEVGKEGILDDFLPLKSGVRWSQSFSCGVVLIEGCAYGGRPFLERSSNVLAEGIS